MTRRILTANEALALGALQAGAKVLVGYPGTPSSGALDSLMGRELPGRHVEWSTNEKVAFEIAAGAAWAGQRALVTMKMSGVNVAYDSLISIAYSGVTGGLVIYVADDPGTSAGMCEQDSRGFALLSDLPLLEPASVAEAYELVQVAFELSEAVGTPVFVRLVTAVASSAAEIEVAEPEPPPEREPRLERDIQVYTKAGAAICMAQHRDLLRRLELAEAEIEARDLNRLSLAPQPGGVGVVVSGAVRAYLEEGLERAEALGMDRATLSFLRLVAPHPLPVAQVQALLAHCATLLVLEELEPHVEQGIYVEAQRAGWQGRIVGKLEGPLERIGAYGMEEVVRGLATALGLPLPEPLATAASEALAAPRPITCCAGCPHRGTYMAINAALRQLKYKRDQVMVTGDIGCTILGMNPPFYTVWNEVSMGASIGLAQGYVHSGVETPVIATIGDSTFFHGGIPGLINALQHDVPLTLVVMDNGWTSMTGMQVNPGTAEAFQGAQFGVRRVDLARIIPALGVEHFFVMDPFAHEEATGIVRRALELPGVKVILARAECAIQAQRRGEQLGEASVDPETCIFCKKCITVTGCPALALGEGATVIDPALCYGCGLCAAVCPVGAITVEEVQA